MKTVIVSKDFMKDSDFLSSSSEEFVNMVEIEEEEVHCEGCGDDIFFSGIETSTDFLWHPKKKF